MANIPEKYMIMFFNARDIFYTPFEAMEYDIFSGGFLERSSRKDLIAILQFLYRNDKHRKYSKKACKKRMFQHILFWFELRGGKK